MTKAETAKKAKKEAKKIRDLFKKLAVRDEEIRMLEPVIQNTSWMKVKLEEALDSEEMGSLVVEYDNGGGQTGVRENPWFKAYEALWKSYMLGMGRILDALPDEAAEAAGKELQAEAPQTVLEMIRAKRRKDA